jgi:hypothetical protein
MTELAEGVYLRDGSTVLAKIAPSRTQGSMCVGLLFASESNADHDYLGFLSGKPICTLLKLLLFMTCSEQYCVIKIGKHQAVWRTCICRVGYFIVIWILLLLTVPC